MYLPAHPDKHRLLSSSGFSARDFDHASALHSVTLMKLRLSLLAVVSLDGPCTHKSAPILGVQMKEAAY